MENLEEGVGVVTSNVSNKDCFAASVVGVVMFLSLSLSLCARSHIVVIVCFFPLRFHTVIFLFKQHGCTHGGTNG